MNSMKQKEHRSDAVAGSTNTTMEACTVYHNEDKDSPKIGLNKSHQKCGVTMEQSADEKPELRKGIKHKNFGSSATKKCRGKLRKLESISSTEQKPLSTEQKTHSTEQKPLSTEQKFLSMEQKRSSRERSNLASVASTDSQLKNKSNSSLSTSSVVTTQRQKSKNARPDKIARVRSDKIAGVKSDKIARVKSDKIAPIKLDKIARVKSDKIAGVKPDKIAPVKSDKIAGVKSDKIARVKPDKIALVKSDKIVPVKSDKIAGVKSDKIDRVRPDMKSKIQKSKTSDKSSKQAQAARSKQETVDSLQKPARSKQETVDPLQKPARSKQETVDPLQKPTSSKKKEKNTFNKHQQKTRKAEAAPAVDTSDPMALLMMMEGHPGNPSLPVQPRFTNILSASTSHTEASWSDGEQELDEQATTSEGETEGMSDWEEVHDHHLADKSQIPDGPVQITLQMPDILRHKKRQKKTFDWKAHLERRIKRFKKEVAADMHKVHLLCLLSLGLRQNEAVNDVTVTAVMLSLLPPEYLASTKLSVQRRVENLLLWYKRKFSLENIKRCSQTRLITATSLTDAVSQGAVTDARVWILMFISMLRTIGLSVRLVLSFQPVRFKAHQGWDEKKGVKGHKRSSAADAVRGGAAVLSPQTKSDQTPASSKGKGTHPAPKKNSAPKRRLSRRESSKKAVLKNKMALKECDQDDDDGDVEGSVNDDSDDSDFSESCIQKMKEIKKKTTPVAHDDDDSTSSELEFEESRASLHNPFAVLKDLKILSNRKILSPATSDDEAAGGKRHGPLGHDIWLEVYMPDSKKWVCLDCFKSEFGKPYSIESSATQPLMYVLGFKNDNSVKDVTARYAKQWLSHTRKNRIDQYWWTETLLMFDLTPFTDNLIEDDEIKGQLLVRPMPTSIGEFKSHPLYALRRHLLKFEAVYPDTAIPLGYIKKEPVYARECVRTLHSRDNWLKEGRLVRLKEHPYKMVKSRPKWNKPKENPDALDLELFGEWQTEQYIPMPAVNGKVPRNQYGNVELFKPWMLPKGTVQVRGNGMQRVAKKLNIDVAPAMVGWDNHSGFSHPLMDGWVVCEEFADTLMAAWLEDQEIQEQRELEKIEKRVYDNWRLLIRGMLIKERLKNKFLQEAPPSKRPEKQETFSDEEEAVDVQLSWPRNRQDQLTEEMSKIVELKSERERKIVQKAHGVGVVNLQDGGEVKCDDEKKVSPARLRDVSLSEGKRKAHQLVQSESGSSDEEEEGPALKLKQGKVKKRRSIEDEDPDFIACGSHRKTFHKERKGSTKVRADENKKDVDDRMGDGLCRRRTSLSRQAKGKLKLVDDSSSDTEICGSGVGAGGDDAGGDSDFAEEEIHKRKGSKVKGRRRTRN